jgi:hypothetical protein
MAPATMSPELSAPGTLESGACHVGYWSKVLFLGRPGAAESLGSLRVMLVGRRGGRGSGGVGGRGVPQTPGLLEGKEAPCHVCPFFLLPAGRRLTDACTSTNTSTPTYSTSKDNCVFASRQLRARIYIWYWGAAIKTASHKTNRAFSSLIRLPYGDTCGLGLCLLLQVLYGETSRDVPTVPTLPV